ncbi:hypothetical protein SDC9_193027 [bioreactor metagenome]|uniref:Uncharacterized protein n=1 Tax=bioreactor metagenome TaxID=1076179 RepID=A0A645I2S5_9ZZZZ
MLYPITEKLEFLAHERCRNITDDRNSIALTVGNSPKYYKTTVTALKSYILNYCS